MRVYIGSECRITTIKQLSPMLFRVYYINPLGRKNGVNVHGAATIKKLSDALSLCRTSNHILCRRITSIIVQGARSKSNERIQ